MKTKTDREIMVYRSRRSPIWPTVVLDGKWLGENGFAPGDKISIYCEGGRLIIENTGRRWDTA